MTATVAHCHGFPDDPAWCFSGCPAWTGVGQLPPGKIEVTSEPGPTLRDRFAMAALADGALDIALEDGADDAMLSEVAQAAYRLADAMLAAREVVDG